MDILWILRGVFGAGVVAIGNIRGAADTHYAYRDRKQELIKHNLIVMLFRKLTSYFRSYFLEFDQPE